MTPKRKRLLSALLVLLVVGSAAVASPAGADDLDDKREAAQARADAADAAREAAEAQLEELDGAAQQAAADLIAVEAQLPAAQARVDAAAEALAKAQREQALIADRLQAAQDEEQAVVTTIAQDDDRATQIRAAIGQMAREAYKSGTDASGLDVVLGAESSEDFVQRYGLLSTALRTQSQVLDELSAIESANRSSQARLTAVKERIAELKAEADAKVAEADAARQEATAAKAAIDDLVAQQTAKKAALESQRADIEAQLAKIDAERSAVESELNAIIAEQRARDSANQAPTGSVSGALFGNPTSISPIYVTSEYGMRLHPTLGYVRLHAGIDLRTYCGTPIYAGRDGTVVWAKSRYGFGNQVMVDHGFYRGNSLMSSYNHMTSFVVSAGQSVSQGQLLGYSGNTGTSAACHLHFEVYVNGATVNPRPLLGL
ncbi:M23 family metallopeptidase [Cellulomonas soli]|uniref:Metalloendopeptidase n=1 Tax=Cellulomonas soli TaxID=931535 RepID=A0A512PIJ9_9CELL|nr:M23 family metallopeptidase [Cellulomonas soli]NYI57465.1 murein DD-endopeptidase MepM/ murein hydrolase activator NlpD [Cellulomonas soli]GEP71029.1 metalloendopeptidase [Cellulomonas soli]